MNRLRFETSPDDKGIVCGAEGQIAAFNGFLSKRRHIKIADIGLWCLPLCLYEIQCHIKTRRKGCSISDEYSLCGNLSCLCLYRVRRRLRIVPYRSYSSSEWRVPRRITVTRRQVHRISCSLSVLFQSSLRDPSAVPCNP